MSDAHGEAAVESTAQNEHDDDDDGFVDILGSGDVLRKVLTPGKGRDSRPVDGQEVDINLEASIGGTTLDVKTDPTLGRITLTIGDNDVAYALDLTLKLAELGETFVVQTTSRYDTRDLPSADAKIEYRVELLAVRDAKLIQDMNDAERLAQGNKKKERGNVLYGAGQYDLASMSFAKAMRYLTEGLTDKDASDEVNQLKLHCLNNLAAVQLKTGAFDMAIKTCDDALRLDPVASKAKYRKSKAYYEKKDYDRAISLLRELVKAEPTNSSARNLLSSSLKERQKEKDAEKNLYTKMVSALDGSSPDVVAIQQELDKKKAEETNDNYWEKFLWISLAILVVSVSVATIWPLIFPPLKDVLHTGSHLNPTDSGA